MDRECFIGGEKKKQKNSNLNNSVAQVCSSLNSYCVKAPFASNTLSHLDLAN